MEQHFKLAKGELKRILEFDQEFMTNEIMREKHTSLNKKIDIVESSIESVASARTKWNNEKQKVEALSGRSPSGEELKAAVVAAAAVAAAGIPAAAAAAAAQAAMEKANKNFIKEKKKKKESCSGFTYQFYGVSNSADYAIR